MKQKRKTFYVATARNKINLSRSNYASAGKETFTEYCLPKDEFGVKFHILLRITHFMKNNFYR